jgi:tetratricopeptide (TPR) repeat protein
MQAQNLTVTKVQLPQNPQAIQMMAMAIQFETRGEMGSAIRMYEQALNFEPGNSTLLVCLGNALFENGRHEEAEPKLCEALAQDKENGIGWSNLVRCYLVRKDFQGALEAANQAVRYSPDFSMAWANRAAALYFLKRYNEAEESARRSIVLDNYNPVGRYYLGMSLKELRRYAEAREQFEFLIKAHPNLPEIGHIRELLAARDFR